jgi:5-methylcytosine-specific restriction protein A
MIDKTIYTTSRWRSARKRFLSKNPLCVDHQRRGLIVQAVIVDHIRPHKQDETLFWDENNWQPLCKRCHDSNKQRFERSGIVAGCSLDGMPLDPGHHWFGAEGGGYVVQKK